jgi:hypothetical protein
VYGEKIVSASGTETGSRRPFIFLSIADIPILKYTHYMFQFEMRFLFEFKTEQKIGMSA